jgi:hypothetical protein
VDLEPYATHEPGSEVQSTVLLNDCCNDLIRVVPKPAFAGGRTLSPPHSIECLILHAVARSPRSRTSRLPDLWLDRIRARERGRPRAQQGRAINVFSRPLPSLAVVDVINSGSGHDRATAQTPALGRDFGESSPTTARPCALNVCLCCLHPEGPRGHGIVFRR